MCSSSLTVAWHSGLISSPQLLVLPMASLGLPETVDVAVVSWREQWPGYTLSSSSVQGSESVLREIWDKAPSYSVHKDKHMRGRVLEALWFGSCKFIPIICLQLRPVCTVCLQSGAINVIVRGCSWLKCLSYFSLPGFKWALAGFVSQCFSFPNVNASLDLYQPLYTLPFFIVLIFPGSNTNNKGSISEWDVSSDLCQQRCSFRGKICSHSGRCKEP